MPDSVLESATDEIFGNDRGYKARHCAGDTPIHATAGGGSAFRRALSALPAPAAGLWLLLRRVVVCVPVVDLRRILRRSGQRMRIPMGLVHSGVLRLHELLRVLDRAGVTPPNVLAKAETLDGGEIVVVRNISLFRS
jgi:hypothetical protein